VRPRKIRRSPCKTGKARPEPRARLADLRRQQKDSKVKVGTLIAAPDSGSTDPQAQMCQNDPGTRGRRPKQSEDDGCGHEVPSCCLIEQAAGCSFPRHSGPV